MSFQDDVAVNFWSPYHFCVLHCVYVPSQWVFAKKLLRYAANISNSTIEYEIERSKLNASK
jgi:hypothetical protein